MNEAAGTAATQAYEGRRWTAAYEAYADADDGKTLTPPDLERFATTTHLLGRDDEGQALMVRAHRAYLAEDDAAGAARCAFWLAMALMEHGDMAQAGGWLARASRVLEEAGAACAERGYLLIPQGLQLLESQPEAALERFDEALELASRFKDVDLATMARLGRGQSLIQLGEVVEGASHLDEAMVAVLAGDVSPVITGVAYCAVVETCQLMLDLRRAQEWTAALTAWCESQPDLVPFRGRCLVYRAEVMLMQGQWTAAASEALRAGEMLSGMPAAAEAYYCQGELHRVRGNNAEADAAYGRAEEFGRRPEPGRALLRLSQGRPEAAVTAIRHALDEAEAPPMRAALLPAAVTIFLSAGDLEQARDAADELSTVAGVLDVPFVQAHAAKALGAVTLAVGNAASAMEHLRRSFGTWQSLQLPYETAATHELLADAALALGDDETARVHLDAARQGFETLGARPDLQRLTAGSEEGATDLTPRELEVLRLLATGMTNRAIASNLVISEKTAANHVSSILAKLGLSSRAAATAFAHEHGLL